MMNLILEKMNDQLGDSNNMNHITLHTKLFNLVVVNSGIQSYMDKIINDLILKLQINSIRFADCLLWRHSFDQIIYYGDTSNTNGRSKFVKNVKKSFPEREVIDYSLASNYYRHILSAEEEKLKNDEADQLSSKKRNIDEDNQPRKFRQTKK
jgi:hypothetical protein